MSSTQSPSSLSAHDDAPENWDAAERHAPGRWLQWLSRTQTTEHPEVRAGLLATIAEPWPLMVLASCWVLAAAVTVMMKTGARWPLLWIAADLTLLVTRTVQLRRHLWRIQARHRLDYRGMLASHLLWAAVLAGGVFGCMLMGNHVMDLLASLTVVGFVGYSASRYAAVTRYALVFIVVLTTPYALGLALSPLGDLWIISLLVPLGAYCMYRLAVFNHQTLVGALRTMQENRRLSLRDALTGLPNRMDLRARLSELCEALPRNPRKNSGFAVVCMDLDGFKRVNDLHGHGAGDRLLRSVADRLRSAVRARDVVCRLGGDEFVVLLPGADRTLASEIARRILHAIAPPHEVTPVSTAEVGMSLGIALAPEHGNDPDTLVSRADEALYRVKREGKGTFRFHT